MNAVRVGQYECAVREFKHVNQQIESQEVLIVVVLNGGDGAMTKNLFEIRTSTGRIGRMQHLT